MSFSIRRSVVVGCLLGWMAACGSGKPGEATGVVRNAVESPDGLVSAVLSYTSDWGTGYCANVHVSNSGSTATTAWSVAIALNQSTVTSSWSGQFATSGDQLTATPLGWNAAIQPGGATDLGFCANAPSATSRPTITAVTQTGASGGGGSGGAPAATGGTGPSSSGGTTSASGGAGPATGAATIGMQSDWGAGFCANVTVNNSGSSPSTGWTVVIDLQGATVTSSWSASYASNNGVLTVTPLSWNANIPANGSTSVGFCANASGTARPVIISSSVDGGGAGTGGTGAGTGGTAPASSGGTAPSTSGGTAPTSTGGTGPSTSGPATIGAQSDWGAGYCANVTVTNSTTAPATSWTVVIALNGATVTSSWSATFANSGDTLTATPLSWNANIATGASVGFGYCANGTGRPTIVSATLTGGGDTGTGGAGSGGAAASTGGTAPASSGGTAPASGGTAPASSGGTAPASGGTAPASSGGTATGGTATGGTATGGAASSCIGETVTTLPTQGTACTTPDQSQCDASGEPLRVRARHLVLQQCLPREPAHSQHGLLEGCCLYLQQRERGLRVCQLAVDVRRREQLPGDCAHHRRRLQRADRRCLRLSGKHPSGVHLRGERRRRLGFDLDLRRSRLLVPRRSRPTT